MILDKKEKQFVEGNFKILILSYSKDSDCKEKAK